MNAAVKEIHISDQIKLVLGDMPLLPQNIHELSSSGSDNKKTWRVLRQKRLNIKGMKGGTYHKPLLLSH
jgi:hypothetical protein